MVVQVSCSPSVSRLKQWKMEQCCIREYYIYYIEKPNSALFCSATGINLHCTYVARCLPVCKYHAHNKNNSGNINFRFGVEVDLLHRMERIVNQSLCHTPWVNCSCLNPNVSTCFPPPRCCCYYRLAHRLLLFPTSPPHLFIVINISTIPKYTLFIYLSFHQMGGPPFFMAPSYLDRCNFRFLDHFKSHSWQVHQSSYGFSS